MPIIYALSFTRAGRLSAKQKHYTTDSPESNRQIVKNLRRRFYRNFQKIWLRKVKDKKNICLMLYPLMGVFIFCARFFVNNVYMFIFFVAMAMLFQGTTNPVEATFYYDMAVVAQSKMGKDPTPTFIAIQQFGPGIAGIISGNTLAWTLVGMSYDPNAPVTDVVKNGFINGYSLVPCVVILVGWICMFFFYKITPEKVAEARAAVAATGQTLVSQEAIDVD